MHAPPGTTKPNPVVDAIRELKWTCPAGPPGLIGRGGRLPGSTGAVEHVTVLSAPVGAGKTVFAAGRARAFPGGAAWCVLDAGDSDPHEFGISVLEAVLRVRSPGDLDSGAGTVGSRSDPLDEALRLAAFGSPLMIVLDACEALDPRSMHATLGRLVRRVPAHVPLVLVAAQDVELPVRLRGATRMLELRAADLAFTVDDVRELFASVGLAVPEPDIATLTEWTGGLASTVNLAVAAYRDADDRYEFMTAATSSRRSPHIFLTSCILDALAKELRTFLAEISIVERISVDLARAITGAEDSAEQLRELARAGLFIDAVPSLAGWYQHRHPMRELIHAELLHEDPLGAMAAETRASIWFQSIGDADRALEHAASGDDSALLTQLVRDRWIAAAIDDRPANMASMLTNSEPGSFDDLTACAIELDAGDSVAARARRAVLDPAPRSRAQDARVLRALIDLRLARESAVAADIEAAVDAVTALVSRANVPANGEPSLRALADRALADARLAQGDLETAGRMLERVADDAALHGCRGHLAHATASLALISALSGRLPQALALINADAGTWSTGSFAAGGVHSLAVAACAYHADTLPVAESAITEARHELPPGVYRDAILPVVRARIAASIGDHESARRLVAGVEKTHPELLRVLRDAFGLDAPISKTDSSSSPAKHPHVLALRRVNRAVTSYESQDHDQAFFELECTLELVLRHGFRRLLADCDVAVRPVLLGYVGRARPFGQLAGQLLARLPSDRPATAAPLVETLTERELVVLRYLPSMMLNREIAAEMFFSENTVKTHLKSIYRKFGVTRRRDAVARARELSLL